MKKLLSVFILLILLTLVYALAPKTMVIHLWGENASYRLTYTGLGIHGAGFFGFEPLRLTASSATPFVEDGVTTITVTPASNGWTYLNQGERGQVLVYGFVDGSVPVERGIMIPDINHHLNASTFFAPDGSATGSLRQSTGAYDAITPKFIYHVKVDTGRPVISKVPNA